MWLKVEEDLLLGQATRSHPRTLPRLNLAQTALLALALTIRDRTSAIEIKATVAVRSSIEKAKHLLLRVDVITLPGTRRSSHLLQLPHQLRKRVTPFPRFSGLSLI
jgi:hypothetical protein